MYFGNMSNPLAVSSTADNTQHAYRSMTARDYRIRKAVREHDLLHIYALGPSQMLPDTLPIALL